MKRLLFAALLALLPVAPGIANDIFQIERVDSSITKVSGDYTYYGFLVQVRNLTNGRLDCSGDVHFMDRAGIPQESGFVAFLIEPGERWTERGNQMIRNDVAARVTKTEASIRCRGMAPTPSSTTPQTSTTQPRSRQPITSRGGTSNVYEMGGPRKSEGAIWVTLPEQPADEPAEDIAPSEEPPRPTARPVCEEVPYDDPKTGTTVMVMKCSNR